MGHPDSGRQDLDDILCQKIAAALTQSLTVSGPEFTILGFNLLKGVVRTNGWKLSFVARRSQRSVELTWAHLFTDEANAGSNQLKAPRNSSGSHGLSLGS